MKFFIFLAAILLTITVFSQISIGREDTLSFKYDNAGNQEVRCLNCSRLRGTASTENLKVQTNELTGNDFKYFPNPVENYLELNWKNNKIIHINIFDMNGKTLYNKDVITKNSYRLSFKGYIQGVYLVSVLFEKERTKTFRIIKK